MKTITIKGKKYVMVNERIKEFRNNFKGYSLTSEIVEMTDSSCTVKATIKDEKERVIATGYAREVVGKTPINKFAFVENAETSAWGRALGNFGIGIDEAICTAEELGFKIEHDNDETLKEKVVEEYIYNELCKAKSKEELGKMSRELLNNNPEKKTQIVKAYNDRLAEFIDSEKIS